MGGHIRHLSLAPFSLDPLFFFVRFRCLFVVHLVSIASALSAIHGDGFRSRSVNVRVTPRLSALELVSRLAYWLDGWQAMWIAGSLACWLARLHACWLACWLSLRTLLQPGVYMSLVPSHLFFALLGACCRFRVFCCQLTLSRCSARDV